LQQGSLLISIQAISKLVCAPTYLCC